MEEILIDVFTTHFSVNSRHWVEVTHIIDPHNFYVLPIKYKTFVEKIQALRPQARPSSLNSLDIVLFQMKQSEKRVLARGQIMNSVIDNNITKFTIFALDYGSLELIVPEEYIWKCCDQYKNLMPLAKLCRLAFCSPINGDVWPKSSIDAFKYFVSKDQFNMKIKEILPDKLVVELWNDHPDDISTLMAYTEYSSLDLIQNSISRLSIVTPEKLYYHFEGLKINNIIRVRVLSGKKLNCFYVAAVNDYKKYLKEADNISNLAKQQEFLSADKMKPGEILLALMRTNPIKNRYERAIIKEVVHAERAKVHFVDWGIEEEVHIINMKTISEKFLRLPVLAIFCSLEENKVSNVKLHRFLRPGLEFFITIKQLGNKFESPNIVNIS